MKTTQEKIKDHANIGAAMANQLDQSQELAKIIGNNINGYLQRKKLTQMPFSDFLNMTNNAFILSFSHYIGMIGQEKDLEKKRIYFNLIMSAMTSVSENLLKNREKWEAVFQDLLSGEKI